MLRDDWTPLPRSGVVGVHARVFVDMTDLVVAMLRFSPRATIDEHDAPHVVEVICMDGEGFTSVDGNQAAIKAGETVTWPAGHPHRLWTEGMSMITLMVEHPRRV